MKRNIQHHTDLLINEIKTNKKLTADEKIDLEDILLSASQGTNGLSPEEKLQSVSETVFNIVSLMVQRVLDGGDEGRLAGLYKVLIECKWAIVTLGGLICGLLAYRPEVSAVIKELLK